MGRLRPPASYSVLTRTIGSLGEGLTDANKFVFRTVRRGTVGIFYEPVVRRRSNFSNVLI